MDVVAEKATLVQNMLISAVFIRVLLCWREIKAKLVQKTTTQKQRPERMAVVGVGANCNGAGMNLGTVPLTLGHWSWLKMVEIRPPLKLTLTIMEKVWLS